MRERVLLGHRIAGEESESWGVGLQSTVSWRVFLERWGRELKVAKEVGLGIRLTLDDGYEEGVALLLPVLERFEVPCEIFLCSGFLDGTVRPFEWELTGLLKLLKERSLGRFFSPEGESESRDAAGWYEYYRAPLRKVVHGKRVAWLDVFRERNGLDVAEVPGFLSWGRVRELMCHPLVSFGAHSVSHSYLPSLTMRELWAELWGSKARVREETGQVVTTFAYPYGASSRGVRALAWLAGFRRAFTTVPEVRKRDVSLRIGRYDVNQPFLPPRP